MAKKGRRLGFFAYRAETFGEPPARGPASQWDASRTDRSGAETTGKQSTGLFSAPPALLDDEGRGALLHTSQTFSRKSLTKSFTYRKTDFQQTVARPLVGFFLRFLVFCCLLGRFVLHYSIGNGQERMVWEKVI